MGVVVVQQWGVFEERVVSFIFFFILIGGGGGGVEGEGADEIFVWLWK